MKICGNFHLNFAIVGQNVITTIQAQIESEYSSYIINFMIITIDKGVVVSINIKIAYKYHSFLTNYTFSVVNITFPLTYTAFSLI